MSERRKNVTQRKHNLVMTVSEYMRNRAVRASLIFRVKPDGGHKYVDAKGVEYAKEDIEKKYPIPDTLLHRHNCDGKYVS